MSGIISWKEYSRATFNAYHSTVCTILIMNSTVITYVIDIDSEPALISPRLYAFSALNKDDRHRPAKGLQIVITISKYAFRITK